MSYNQHNAGLHYIQHTGRKPKEDQHSRDVEKYPVYRCPKCRRSMYEITKSGSSVRCIYCGTFTPIDIHMDLSGHFCFEAKKDIYRERAEEYQRYLVQRFAPRLAHCVKCGTRLTEDRYCRCCQVWRK